MHRRSLDIADHELCCVIFKRNYTNITEIMIVGFSVHIDSLIRGGIQQMDAGGNFIAK